jgi:hypothetical protein
MEDHNPTDKDFLGYRIGTKFARINALLPGPEEQFIRKTELAQRAGVPTREAPSAAYVWHLERFVKDHYECKLHSEEPGLIEKVGVRDGRSGAYFRLTQAGAVKKAKHAARLGPPAPTVPSTETPPFQPNFPQMNEPTPKLPYDSSRTKLEKYNRLVISRKSCDI